MHVPMQPAAFNWILRKIFSVHIIPFIIEHIVKNLILNFKKYMDGKMYFFFYFSFIS